MASDTLLTALLGSEFGIRGVADIVAEGLRGIVAANRLRQLFPGVTISTADALDVLGIVRAAYNRAQTIDTLTPDLPFSRQELPVVEWFADLPTRDTEVIAMSRTALPEVSGAGGMRGTLEVTIGMRLSDAPSAIPDILRERLQSHIVSALATDPSIAERIPSIRTPLSEFELTEIGGLLLLFSVVPLRRF